MIQPIFQPRKTTAAQAADPSQPRIGCFSCRALPRYFRRIDRCLATLALAFFSLSQPALSSPNGADGAEGTAALGLDPAPPGEEALNPYRQSISRVDPMDTTGLDYGLANVLRNYYRHNFTGAEHWAQVESIRFEGTLHLPQGSLRFVAFKKRPDLCKVVLETRRGRVAMAYDGQDAWQHNTANPRPASHAVDAQREGGTPDNTAHHSSSPESPAAPSAPRKEKSAITHHSSAINSMPPAEALNFIRDATTGGHLLYPLAAGKQIELLGTTTVDGERCYELKVTLPDGQVIRSMLDMTDYAERRQITINNVTGDEEVNTHSDFRRIDGVRVPFTSTLTVDGEQIHQSRLNKAETNVGTMPWMFTRPVGASPEPSRTDDSSPGEPDPAPDSDEEPPASFGSPDSSFTIDSIWDLPPQ